MIKIQGICKKYQKNQILNDLSVDIEKGKCIAVLGPNGSGKSTFLSILAGITKPESGRFLFDGIDLFTNRKLMSDTVAYVPQGTPLIEELSAYDNLLMWYDRKALSESLSDGVLSELGINDFLKKTVKTLSGGMKKRLSIGCAVSGNPSVLLLDEPTAALDFPCKAQIAAYITSFKQSGGSVIITTHDIGDLEVCDNTYIMKGGRLAEYSGKISSAELTKSYE